VALAEWMKAIGCKPILEKRGGSNPSSHTKEIMKTKNKTIYEYKRWAIAHDIKVIAERLEELGAVYDKTPNEVKREIDLLVSQLDDVRFNLLDKQ
jgi:hypothetical protein